MRVMVTMEIEVLAMILIFPDVSDPSSSEQFECGVGDKGFKLV